VTVLRSGSASDVGRVRTVNQDLPLERSNLYAVADGMGGHVGGEVAARVAVDTLDQTFEKAPTVDGLRAAFSEANAAVWHESQANPDLRGMGTTMTALALVGGAEGKDVLALANVGDSRAYIFSGGHLVQATADHSLAEERMRHGEMTEAEAAVHPQRHILTRALGVSSDVDTDMWELDLHTGDRVLLCSDGLSNEVGIDEMAEILGAIADPQQAAERLVEAANEHGGADNITVIIVDVQVGEEGRGSVATITPLGLGAATAAVGGAALATAAVPAVGASAAADTPAAPTVSEPTGSHPSAAGVAATASVRMDDTLAPGAHVGFDDQPTLAGQGPPSDEFFMGTATSVPVARSTARVPPAPAPQRGPSEKESRGARRRRLGIPRRVTPRVIGFILLVAAVPVAAYYVLRWYAYDNWTVTLQGNQIVVKQGQQGGVLWFHPKVVDRTGVTTSQILPTAVAPVRAGVQEPSLSAARRYVHNLQTQATTTTTTVTTTTVPAHGSQPTPGAPATTTTTAAATTTTAAASP
jgi:serine/threonine protein phosphatase PrpC